MRRLMAIMIALASVSGASAQSSALSGEQLSRYHALNAELRCLVCQNRSIAESDAPLAKDLREIVGRQIAAGRSDAEIKQYLVDRYGQWVLYDPPLDTDTLILWIGPFVLLAIGLIVVALVMRRRKRTTTDAAPALDRARLAAVLDESRTPDRGDAASTDRTRS